MLLLPTLLACGSVDDQVTPSTSEDTSPTTDTQDTGPVEDTGEACSPQPAVEGAYMDAFTAASVSGSLAACEGALHAVAGPEGAQIELTLADWSSTSQAEWTLRTVGGSLLGQGELMWGGRETVTLPWTGEFLVELRSVDESASDYGMRAECIRDCQAQWTRYPLFFMHGVAGTEAFVGVLDYWYGVDDALSEAGYVVWISDVDPYQSTDVRGGQWVDNLDAFLADGKHRRVNLVGHSQGGVDARHLASQLDPDKRVVSVTTIASPHRGTPIADIATGVVDSSLLTQVLVDGAIDALMLFYGSSNDQDVATLVEQMSTAGMEAFNEANPDRADVMYQSWTGVTCGELQFSCQSDHSGEVVTPVFSATRTVLDLQGIDSDGLIPVESAKWGTYHGTIDADHIDQIGQIAGATAPGFEHLDFYREVAGEVAAQGF